MPRESYRAKKSDRYAKEYEVAKARCEEMSHHQDLVAADAREEDRAMAEANLQLAKARLEEARAVLDKTFVRAPLDGTVLRKYHRAGESVSNSATNPDPIFTIGDKRALRVRVDVDEADVSKLSLGQSAYVTADAYGSKRFAGHVVRIGQQLGRKNVRTDEPSEHVDNKILETLVELDSGAGAAGWSAGQCVHRGREQPAGGDEQREVETREGHGRNRVLPNRIDKIDVRRSARCDRSIVAQLRSAMSESEISSES